MIFRTSLLALALFAPLPASAQMVTAEQIRPILDATKSSWIAVRRWEGQDLIYFTHLESWRCGLSGVRFGINDEEPVRDYELAFCDETAANPMAFDAAAHPPYLSFPLDSIKTITVEITYDDDKTDLVTFDRAKVETP